MRWGGGRASVAGVNSLRTVQAEILDGLAPDCPEAIASRRDLRVINRLMGGERWLGRELRGLRRAGERVLEIGAGEGTLARALDVPANELAALDLAPRPAAWPAGAEWHQSDVLAFAGWWRQPVVVANLFLHHFSAETLGRIGAELNRHARVVLISEPLRARRSATLFRLLCPIIGAHAVTRHDGRVSIEAGFRGRELPDLLGLPPAHWQTTVEETALAGYRMKAVRRA